MRYPLIVLVILAFGYAGNADFEDDLAEEREYVERVCEGTHSDYLSLGVDCAKISRPVSGNRY